MNEHNRENLKNIKRNKKKIFPKVNNSYKKIKVKVIGVGGGGGSIISEIAPNIEKVDFVVANVDSQALDQVPNEVKKILFGRELTHGLGCGMNPNIGKQSAELYKEVIKKEIKDADLCIFVACLGGGTGSGAMPVFTEIAKSLKKKSFGIFTFPFNFEGEKRKEIANRSLERMKRNLNAFTVIPNDKIFQIIGEKTPLRESLSAVNRILSKSLSGLIEMIYTPGLINIDFADLKTTLEGRGKIAYLSSVEVQGQNRAIQALNKVLHDPLNKYNLRARSASINRNENSFLAEKVLFNITASKNLKMLEVEQISKTISNFNKFAKIIFGISENQKYKDTIRITLLAIGSEKNSKTNRKTNQPIILSKSFDEKIVKDNKVTFNKRNEASNIRQKKKPIKKEGKLANNQKPRIGKKGTIEINKEQRGKKANQEKNVNIIFPKSQDSLDKKPSVSNKQEEEKSTSYNIKTRHSIFASKDKRQNRNNKSKNDKPRKIRKNALEVKKELEQTEKEILEEEKKWDIPTFLRRKKI